MQMKMSLMLASVMSSASGRILASCIRGTHTGRDSPNWDGFLFPAFCFVPGNPSGITEDPGCVGRVKYQN